MILPPRSQCFLSKIIIYSWRKSGVLLRCYRFSSFFVSWKELCIFLIQHFCLQKPCTSFYNDECLILAINKLFVPRGYGPLPRASGIKNFKKQRNAYFPSPPQFSFPLSLKVLDFSVWGGVHSLWKSLNIWFYFDVRRW